jgi:response regulator RpfG family c-di-GMP phosphodiesterase
VPDSNATVLLVDDEPMMLAALRGFFQLETSYRILTAGSAAAALEVVDAEPVEAVIADFMMPEMDGIRLLAEVRRRRPEATRILLTGYADKESAIRAINEAGLYQYLEKPWDNEQLRITVRNAVERSRLVRDLEQKVRALESTNQDLSEIRSRLIRALL